MKSTMLRSMMLWLILALVGFSVFPAAAQPTSRVAMDPARTASLTAASRRIEDRFVADVARIVGTTSERVRRAMPDERRITSAASRLISALEVDLGTTLTPEQQAEILEADQARKLSLAKAREAAVGTP